MALKMSISLIPSLISLCRMNEWGEIDLDRFGGNPGRGSEFGKARSRDARDYGPSRSHTGWDCQAPWNKFRRGREAMRLLTDPSAYQKMAQTPNPYGDGKAWEEIFKIVDSYWA